MAVYSGLDGYRDISESTVMAIRVPFLATAIGSFPHMDATAALDVMFSALPEAPVWPQLPKAALLEQMEIQYSEGMPRAVVDRGRGRLYFDTAGDYSEDMASFYEKYLAAMDPDGGNGDCSALAIGPEYSRGIYALEERLKKAGRKFPFVKVHTVGPCSFSLSVTDEQKRAIYYHEEFRDMAVKALAMKCRWQIQRFRPYADRVICFIDEPVLSAFGSSAYISVKREDVMALVSEVVAAVHADGAIAGIHCCGNTDWSIVIETGADVVNLDAYAYGETIALYPDAVKGLIARGGEIAWGIVPTSVAVREESAGALAGRMESLISHLASKTGVDAGTIALHSIITPSCGTGTISTEDAERVFSILGELPGVLRAKFGV